MIGIRRSAVRVLRLIRDLFAEVVAFAEDFAADVNNVFGVGIVFSENDCLRY